MAPDHPLSNICQDRLDTVSAQADVDSDHLRFGRRLIEIERTTIRVTLSAARTLHSAR